MSSTEITATRGGALAEKMDWARALAPAGMIPKAYQQNPANLLLAAELADALGIPRINALTSIHVVEGRPSASADLMASLVRRAGHRLRVQVRDDAAKATLVRADDPDFEFEATWTIERARAAGLAGKNVWKAYPQAMLRSRAITEVIRMGASEVLSGAIYTPEELGVAVDGQGEPLKPLPVTTAVTVAELLGDAEPDIESEPVDVTDAEVLPDDDTLTEATRGRMFALLTEQGITDADQQRQGMGAILGRTVESRATLTETEARDVIASLEARG